MERQWFCQSEKLQIRNFLISAMEAETAGCKETILKRCISYNGYDDKGVAVGGAFLFLGGCLCAELQAGLIFIGI
jgi:hypothetical protein